MASIRNRRPDDRGVLLVLGATLMVAMLAFSALAVDIANARQYHRQLQNAADAAALAAGQDLPDMALAVQTVKDYTERNYDVAASEWIGCQDPDHLPVWPDSVNANQCISFPADGSRVRVVVPDQQVDTYFGSAIGRDTLSFGAEATAAAVVGRADRIIPAAVTGPMGTGLLCIEQAGNNQPCANRERGQFGSLASPRLNIYMPSSNVGQSSLAINYAMNLDHNIEEFSGFPAVCDGPIKTPCVSTNDGTNLIANHLITTTGNDVPPVTEGYVTGFQAATSDQGNITFCGRLERPDFTAENLIDPRPSNCNSPGQPTIDVLGHTINGRHLYFWLDDDARALFYPEAWEQTQKGTADTNSTFALTNSTLWAPGDLRLDCFLAGYRFDTATAVETLPDCTSVGLTLPGAGGPEARQVGDSFNGDYSHNSGAYPFLNSWTEVGDDGSPSSGIISYASGYQVFNMPETKNPAVSLERSLDLSNATAATLKVAVTKITGASGTLDIEVSTDGSSWTTVGSISPSTKPPAILQYDISAYTGGQLDVRLAFQTETSGLAVGVDAVLIDYTYQPPPSQIAPIFREGFNTDPRWAVIPRVGGYNNPNATPIEGFWGFFAYTSYTNKTKVQAFDGWVFDPALMLSDPAADTFFYGFSPEPVVRLVE